MGGSLAGAGVGALAGAAIAGGAQKVAPAIGGLFGNVPTRARIAAVSEDEARRLSAETAIPIMTSDAIPPRTFMGRIAQVTGERIPFAGTGGKRSAQQERRVEAIRDVLDEFGGLSGDQAIDNVMQDLSAQRSNAITEFTGIKRRIIDKLVGKGTVPVENTVRAIDQQITHLRSLNTEEVAPVIEKLEDWRTAIQGQGIENVETLRKQFGEAFRSPELAAVRDTGTKALSAIYGPLREDMTAYVAANLGKGEARRFTRANESLAEMAGELNVTRLRNVLRTGEATPEDVGKLLFSSKPSEVRRLYNGLSDKGKANARTAIMQQVFDRLGGDVDNISPDRFLSVMRQVGEPVGVFFQGADAVRLQGVVRAVQLTRRAGAASAAPPTGAQNWPMLAALGLGGTLGGVKGAAAGASIGLVARVYESQAVRNALLKLGRTQPGSTQESAAFARLQGIATREAGSNVVNFPVAEALAQSPGRLAARENEDN
jgi:hypothetical protein